jgi:hypothetical protein
MKRAVLVILAVAVNAILTAVSQAHTNSCISSTDGFWDEARIWSLNRPPSIHQSAILITNAASETITIDSDTARHFKHTLTISNLNVSAPSGSTDTLYLDNTGTIALHILNDLTIGVKPTGNPYGGISELVTTNSTLVVDGITGGQIRDDGTIVIMGGSLITTNCSLRVADLTLGGVGFLIISNGTVLARDIIINSGESSTGIIELFGGTITLSSSLNVGDGTGDAPGALFVANGGLLVVTNAETFMGGIESSGGTMTVSNATFLGADVYIGGFKTGSELVIDNGTVTLSGQLGIGYGDLCGGSVSMNGGLLVITNNPTTIGIEECDGELTIEDGIFLAREVLVGSDYHAEGAVVIDGGITHLSSYLQVGNFNGQSSASVEVNGGQLLVTSGDIAVEGDAGIAISGGFLAANYIHVGAGDFLAGGLSVNGGSVTASTGITLGDCASNIDGYVTVSGGQLIVTNAAGTGFIDVQSGQLVLSGGVLQVDKLVMTNTCSSFVHTGGTLIVGTVVLDPNTFAITSVAREGNDLRVTWLMAPGSTNALQVSCGGVQGACTMNNFTDLFVVTNNSTAGSVTNYLDIGAATNFPSRYYRARLAP